ncbi:hypothetical protein LTR37_010479 [Vermiconidia calcicola]|uniref:Uncharacterized protein n=1 Tax=Vermiconidia calcicola TaxID=1690605 RepID=A0ACC3N4T9_9PEZI|nr:hypothetical protein LTR37_010479 [Vermiconidia calcicola]
MEALAAASSIAGLLSLTGQCISGAQKLVSFYQDIATASKAVMAFMKDTNSLLRSLHDTDCLLRTIEEKAPKTIDVLHLTTLKLQLEDCDNDVKMWLQTAQRCEPAASRSFRGMRSWFRQFISAVDKDSIRNVREEMQRRRTEIALALSTLGRSFDMQLAIQASNIVDGVRHTGEVSQMILKNCDETQQGIDRLEVFSCSISNSIGSMKSLASVARSASTLQSDRPESLRAHTGLPSDEMRFKSVATFPEDSSISWGDSLENRSLQDLALSFERRPIGYHTTIFVSQEELTEFSDPLDDGFNGATTEDGHGETALMMSSWDDSLLSHWVDGRDRVNRWLLHMLGTDIRQGQMHRTIVEEHCNVESASKRTSSDSTFGRLAIKHWFIDEAATGRSNQSGSNVDLTKNALSYLAQMQNTKSQQSGPLGLVANDWRRDYTDPGAIPDSSLWNGLEVSATGGIGSIQPVSRPKQTSKAYISAYRHRWEKFRSRQGEST